MLHFKPKGVVGVNWVLRFLVLAFHISIIVELHCTLAVVTGSALLLVL